ncbi:MAG: helix-turn-helix domain-containing protein [Bacteroides sp.]|nr:helix-turn-helix domain-containing protein [Bacteroides sp.]
MKHFITIIIGLFSMLHAICQAYCTVTTYDEDSGLSQRLVKGIVQDNAGYIWIGTWNGLNRFDGKEFVALRPDYTDEAFRYSNRISDLHLSPKGNLLCRIDDRISLFDVNTFHFTDLHSQIEEAIGQEFVLSRNLPTRSGEIVLATKDGKYIVIPDEDHVAGAKLVDQLPKLQYRPRTGRRIDATGPYGADDIAMSQMDSLGTLWIVTRDGAIVSSPGKDGPFTVRERIDVVPGSLYYCTTDNSGNVWLRSSEGAHRVVLGQRPYSTVATHDNTQVREAMTDSSGRIWLSESDALAVAVMDTDTGSKKYLGSDGRLSDTFTPFGTGIYAIAESRDGTIWLGSKPSGAFRLTPSGDNTYEISEFKIGNVYDFLFDSKGGLWIATMGGGVMYCPDPSARTPRFKSLSDMRGYPANAQRIRHLAVSGDTMLLGATTAGLLAVDMREISSTDSLRASLLVSRPGVAASLGNIAVMDVTVAADGSILVATESDGVNVATPAAIDRPDEWIFKHFNASSGLTDVAHAVADAGSSLPGWYVVTSENRIFLFNPSTGRKTVFGRWYWGDRLRFTDAHPVMTADGRWLLSHDNGAVMVRLDTTVHHSVVPPVLFTAVSVQGAPERLLSADVDSIVLAKHERNLTVRFAALDYSGSNDIDYFVKLGEDDWVSLGHQNSLTLLDLDPGEYTLAVRASTPAGNIIDNTDTITIIVTPTFWETTTAKVLYVLAILIMVGACVWTVVYIRAIKRKQREILNAYLSVVKSTSEPAADSDEHVRESAPEREVEKLPLSDEDKALMENVAAFVTEHIADPSVTVDDMASAVAISRSSLNRKMKSIMGVSPAEFIRESRLHKAEVMLAQTDRSIKEIAYDCGFADINYFGKAFKASRGVTPGAYRKSELK